MQKYTTRINSNSANDIKFQDCIMTLFDNSELTMEELFNHIIETILKNEALIVKLQSKLLVTKDTCLVYITEY